MSRTYTDLVGRVRIQIRDTGTTKAFTDAELTQFVEDALAEYSRYRPIKRPTTLSVVSGTATYNLPDDWQRVDSESFNLATEPAFGTGSVFSVSGSLSVSPSATYFTWYDDARQVKLSPAPTGTYAISFDYFATHTPSSVPQQWLMIALAPAIEEALRALAACKAVKMQAWKIANSISVDNREMAKQLLAQADAWRERFRKEVVLRPFGTMGPDDPPGWDEMYATSNWVYGTP